MPVKGSQIPQSSRVAVRERARGRCERCGGPGSQWHHRRRRAVVDEHRHAPCNGVWLCQSCHAYIHSHPIDGRMDGFIVPSVTDHPANVPVQTLWGLRWLTCDGKYSDTGERGENDVLHG